MLRSVSRWVRWRSARSCCGRSPGASATGSGGACSMVGGALVVAITAACAGLVPSLAWLLATRFVMGLGEACFFVGGTTMATDLAPESRRGEAVSYWSVAVWTGLGLGPVVGETLLNGSNYDLVWYVAGGLRAPRRGCRARHHARRTKRAMTGERGKLIAPEAIRPGIILAATLIGIAGFSIFLPLYAPEVGVDDVGLLFLVYGVVVLGVRILGARLPDIARADHAPAPIAIAASAVGLLVISRVAEQRRSRGRRSGHRDRIVVPVSRRCCCSRCGASPSTSAAPSSGRSARSSTSPAARPGSSSAASPRRRATRARSGSSAVLAAVALFLLRSGFAGHAERRRCRRWPRSHPPRRSRPRSRERAARHQRLPAQDRRDPVVPPRVVAPAAGRRRDRVHHAPRRRRGVGRASSRSGSCARRNGMFLPTASLAAASTTSPARSTPGDPARSVAAARAPRPAAAGGAVRGRRARRRGHHPRSPPGQPPARRAGAPRRGRDRRGRSVPGTARRRARPGRALPGVVVPPGVDVDRFRPLDPAGRAATRVAFGLDPDVPLVLGVSRLVPRKGFDVLIDAIGGLPDVQLAIAGSGPRPTPARGARRASRRRRESSVPRSGARRRLLPAALRQRRRVRMPCRERWGGLEAEGFGIVFLEAAAAGVPAVAGRSGGSHEAVVDGETGFVVESRRARRARRAGRVARRRRPAGAHGRRRSGTRRR